MANKEERIIIAVAEPSLLEGGADKIYPCMTRQEAIEVMAKAFCETGAPNTWNSVTEENKIFYLAVAEAALNALLEGGK
jgi:hypothetical protein